MGKAGCWALCLFCVASHTQRRVLAGVQTVVQPSERQVQFAAVPNAAHTTEAGVATLT